MKRGRLVFGGLDTLNGNSVLSITNGISPQWVTGQLGEGYSMQNIESSLTNGILRRQNKYSMD